MYIIKPLVKTFEKVSITRGFFVHNCSQCHHIQVIFNDYNQLVFKEEEYMNKRILKYKLVVVLLFILSSMSMSFGEMAKIRKIELTDLPTEVNVGEKIEIKYNITPSSEQDAIVSISTNLSGGSEIVYEDGAFYFTPRKFGTYVLTIETENGKKDSVEIFSKSMLKGVDITIENLDKVHGKYIKYLGMEIESSYELIPRSGVKQSDILLTSVVWQKGTLLSQHADGENFIGHSEKDNKSYVEVTTDDCGYTDRVEIKDTPMTKSIEIDKKVVMLVDNSYKPIANFIAKEDLLYGYKEVINQDLKLSFDEVYVHKDYLEAEKKYEEDIIESLYEKFRKTDDKTEKQEILDEVSKHTDRKGDMKYFLNNLSGSYCQVDKYDEESLTDRDGYYIEVAKIIDGEVKGFLPGKVRLRIQPEDHIALFNYMDILFKENIDEEYVVDKDDKKISLEERNKSLLVEEPSEDKDVDLTEKGDELTEDILKELELEKQIAEFYGQRFGRPSPWAKNNVYEANLNDLLTESIQSSYVSNISEKEFSELTLKLYTKLTGENLSYEEDKSRLTSDKDLVKENMYLRLNTIIELAGKELNTSEVIEIPYSVRDTVTKEQAITVVLNTYKKLIEVN